MKKFLKLFSLIVLAMTASCAMVSCSDNNDEPDGSENQTTGTVNPSNVFTGKRPTFVKEGFFTLNSDGLVTRIETPGYLKYYKVITFDYGKKSRAENADNTVTMIVNNDGDKTFCTMTIGSNGFVSKADVKQGDVSDYHYEEGVWTFKYDDAGHLTEAHHDYYDEQTDPDGGPDQYTVTIQWKDGNVVRTYKDNGWDSYRYKYTSTKYPEPIENKGAIFAFEDIYPIEIYDLEWAYYAGMLGKGPKNLAVSSYEEDEEAEAQYYKWRINNSGYPTLLEHEGDKYGDKDVVFDWD